MPDMVSPPRLFLCYARADTRWIERLRPYLQLLQLGKELSTFFDQQIPAGDKWDQRIRNELARADIVLVVVSIDLLVSDYVTNVELKTAMKRHDRGRTRIIPVIARRCEWKPALGRFQALPKDAKGEIKPLDEWRNRNLALTSVAEQVKAVAATLRGGHGASASARRTRPARNAQVSRSFGPLPAASVTASAHADEMLDLALASGASLFDRCQTPAFWVDRLRQTITMTVRIDADWSVRYEKAITMRVHGAGAIVAAPFRIAARAEAMSRLGAFDIDARYQETGAAMQPLLFPTASHAGKGMEERAFAAVFTPPITAQSERRFLLWFAVPAEFQDTLGKKNSDVLSCLTLQLAREHTVNLRFEVLISRKLTTRLKLHPKFKCDVVRSSVASGSADPYHRYVFTAPPARVRKRLAQAIAVTVDSRVERAL
jgi:hypothetical protein